MSKTRLIGSVEVTINEVLKRLSKLEGRDKSALQYEFKEWIDAIDGEKKIYDIMYINKIR